MGITTSEFPLLGAAGLYVSETIGNGNCLFNALSDQLYGDQSRHAEIRLATIKYMRKHADFYKQFIEVHPGGGIRRNPKRKNAGAYSTSFDAVGPTAEEIDRVFESHLKQMAQGGTYGDNMEIVAFCQAFNVDVKIYQFSFAYMVPVKHDGPAAQVVHIAYHTWEHYSSIRNVAGPHTGLPSVKDIPVSLEAQAEAQEALAQGPHIQPWMINVIVESLPYYADRAIIQKVLEDSKGNVDLAINKLLDDSCQSSASSRGGSSSVERDHDSDEEQYIGPNKKQDRRLSRAKRIFKDGEDKPSQYLSVRLKSPKLPSTQESSSTSESLSNPTDIKDGDETEEEDWRNNSPYKDSESASISTSASEYSLPSNPRSGGVRLKLTQPKRRDKIQVKSPSSSPIRESPTREHRSPEPVRQGGPQLTKPKRRLLSRNQLDMVKKAAQKAAAKDRKREIAADRVASQQPGSFYPTSSKGKANTPAIENHIKVLYI